MIRTETEILGTPEEVRGVFLDAARMPEWHTALFRSIRPVNSATTGDMSLLHCQTGDILELDAPPMKVKCTVLVNTPREFRWTGKMPMGLGTGEHFFIFEGSKVNPGGTHFIHGEQQAGFAAFLFSEVSPLFGTARARFQQFCEDLRGRVAQLRQNTNTTTTPKDPLLAPPGYTPAQDEKKQ